MNNNTHKPMSEKQVAFIRDLFKQVRHLLPEQKANNLINKMKAHTSGEEIQTTVWGSKVIEILKGLKTSDAVRIAKERRTAISTK